MSQEGKWCGDLLCTGRQIGLALPNAARDEALTSIFADAATMLHLPSLCAISQDQMKERRMRHRAEAEAGTSLMLDMMDLATGELVGTSGFRVVDRDEEGANWAEWGVIVAQRFWRHGIAEEVQCLCATLATRVLAVQKIRAATTAQNMPMLRFFAKHGWRSLDV